MRQQLENLSVKRTRENDVVQLEPERARKRPSIKLAVSGLVNEEEEEEREELPVDPFLGHAQPPGVNGLGMFERGGSEMRLFNPDVVMHAMRGVDEEDDNDDDDDDDDGLDDDEIIAEMRAHHFEADEELHRDLDWGQLLDNGDEQELSPKRLRLGPQ
jgi:hypothetical protein